MMQQTGEVYSLGCCTFWNCTQSSGCKHENDWCIWESGAEWRAAAWILLVMLKGHVLLCNDMWAACGL